MPKQVEITPEVRDVLERGEWKGWLFVLPPGQLEKDLYRAVDKVLTALGGKWNKSQRGHMFGTDAKVAMVAALESGVAVDQKRTFEQFFTPREVAEQVADLAGVGEGMLVLEPSAGAGALVEVALERGASVIAVELDSAMMPLLLDIADKWPGRVRRVCEDFLTWQRKLDRQPEFDHPIDCVMMNPPFGRGADMAHVIHALAMLKPDGVLVAIMSPHWTFATDRAAQLFRGLINEHTHDWTPLPEGSFRASGTGVNTGILTIRKGSI